MTWLPLFPLGTVLFPGLPLPLHVFEPRYRRMVTELRALPVDRREFGVVAIRAGHEADGTVLPELFDIGCVAALRHVRQRPDGGFEVLAVGVRRFRLLETRSDASLLRGRVEILAETPGAGESPADEVRAAFARYVEAIRAARGLPAEPPVELPDRPAALSFAVASAALLTVRQRQELLSAADVSTRLRLELRILAHETRTATDSHLLSAMALRRTPLHPN